MLVAEEYERRIKNSRRSGADGQEEIGLFSHVSVSAKRLQVLMKKKIEDQKVEFLEPKNEISKAAMNSLFSA